MRVVPLDRKINPRYRFLFLFFTLEYIWCTKFWAASKKNPTSCMFSMHVLTFFFLLGNVLKKCRRDLNCSLDHSSSWVKNSIISPTKIEQHFGGFWNFETPLMLLSLSQKVAHSMRWKILFSSNIQWIPLVCMFFKIYLTLHINVQSGKIGSAWEWCRWIGKSTRAIGFSFLFITLEYIW